MIRTRKSLVAALVIGLLSGPAIALAGGGLHFGSRSAAAEPVPDGAVAATVTTEITPVTTSVVEEATPADYAAACGVDGLRLVADERSGRLDSVGQAALDALRSICDEAGMPLPAAPSGSAPRTVVETVTVAAPAPTTAGAVAGGDDDEGYGSDDDRYEHEDESEHEYEHEYEHGEDD